MKYSSAIIALLGLYTTEEVKAVQYMGHQGRLDFLNVLIDNGEESSDDSSDEENFIDANHVQLQGDYDEIPAIMNGHDGGYERIIPARFEEERDDRLMNSMVGSYAREAVVDGRLTGHMFLNEADARAASDEVIANHKGADRSAGAEGRFEEVWNHFDVNHDGLVEVERMPQFFRMLLGNALDINLQ